MLVDKGDNIVSTIDGASFMTGDQNNYSGEHAIVEVSTVGTIGKAAWGRMYGINGGEIVFQGSYQELLGTNNSLTANYLSGKKEIPIPEKRRELNYKLYINAKLNIYCDDWLKHIFNFI